MNHPDYKRTKEWALFRLKLRSVEAKNGCIEWIGSKSKQGYGHIRFTLDGEKTKTMYAHRLVWMLHNDAELGPKIYVCHRCDNPSCINIKHLFVGTAKDNQQDMSKKGRARNQGKKVPYDYNNPRKKPKPHSRTRIFTDDQIRAIRNTPGKLRDVATQFGISTSYVSKLRSGKAKSLVDNYNSEVCT